MDVLLECQQVLEVIKTLVGRTNKKSVLVFLQHTKEQDIEPKFPMVRESVSNVIGFVSIGDCRYIHEIVAAAQGIIDKIVVDTDIKRTNSIEIVQSIQKEASAVGISVSLYSDYSSWAISSVQFMLANNYDGGKILILGYNALATRVIMELIARQIHVYLLKSEYTSAQMPYNKVTQMQLSSPYIHIIDAVNAQDGFTTLMGCSLMEQTANLALCENIALKYVYDVGIHNFTKDFIQRQRTLGAKLYRSDDRAGIAGTIINIMETDYMLQNMVGCVSLPNIRLVSGGYLGEEGDVVVDNAHNPKCILGVAAGDGTFKTTLSNEEQEHITKFQSLL